MTVNSQAQPRCGHAKTQAQTCQSACRPGVESAIIRLCVRTRGTRLIALAAAIDQLASDVRGDASDPELAARVAGLWQMVSDLDPELARRRQGYTALPGGVTPD